MENGEPAREGQGQVATTVVDRTNDLAAPDDAASAFTTVVKNSPAEGVEFILREIGETTLIAISPDGGGITGHWLDAENKAAAEQWAAARNASGSNIYFTANRPRHGMKKKPLKADIDTVRLFFADVDAKSGRTMDQALAVVTSLPLPPSLIIMSGGGYQPLWMLDPPILATDDVCGRAEAIGKSVAELSHSDAIQNIDRLLRAPFTVNYPNATKRRVGRTACLSGILVRGSR